MSESTSCPSSQSASPIKIHEKYAEIKSLEVYQQKVNPDTDTPIVNGPILQDCGENQTCQNSLERLIGYYYYGFKPSTIKKEVEKRVKLVNKGKEMSKRFSEQCQMYMKKFKLNGVLPDIDTINLADLRVIMSDTQLTLDKIMKVSYTSAKGVYYPLESD